MEFLNRSIQGGDVKRKIGSLLLFFLIFSVGMIQTAFAENFSEKGVTSRGVIFNVAEDRRIDHLGGYQEPESIDKYIKRKFDDVYAQLNVITEKLDGISTRLETLSRLSE
jgi:hypothetical protein